jgi:hypothetical protein
MNPQNLDLAGWIINQEYVGKPSQAGGDFTMGDVQNAIWLLVDDSLSVDQGPSDPARVQEIINAALLNGESYKPACGDRDIVVLVPVAAGCDLNTTSTDLVSQVIIIEVPVPCGGPGSGTPGYWINHPDAWPVAQVEIGGSLYTKAQAIALMKLPVAKDKRWTMFPALVCAKLNVIIGNDSSCVDDEIALADAWWATFNANSVAGSSQAWKVGEPLYQHLDNYNNGLLCAPHRD